MAPRYDLASQHGQSWEPEPEQAEACVFSGARLQRAWSWAAFAPGAPVTKKGDRGTRLDFHGARLHVVQVGLGTNSTFIQNLGGDWREWDNNTDWLLHTVSEVRPEHITGLGVEPVAEHVHSLRCGAAQRLPHVGLVCAALGEHDSRGSEVFVLTQRAHDALLRQVSAQQRSELQRHLTYLLNMSSVGQEHPELAAQRQWLWDHYHVWASLEKKRTDVWSWERLTTIFNFHGCELLIVDTEGHDAAVLRSMMRSCQESKSTSNVWPDVIQFETMLHCDKVEGPGAEQAVIEQLESAGYLLVHRSLHNSHLVRKEALHREERLKRFVRSFSCATCWRSWQFPYISDWCQKTLCHYCAQG